VLTSVAPGEPAKVPTPVPACRRAGPLAAACLGVVIIAGVVAGVVVGTRPAASSSTSPRVVDSSVPIGSPVVVDGTTFKYGGAVSVGGGGSIASTTIAAGAPALYTATLPADTVLTFAAPLAQSPSEPRPVFAVGPDSPTLGGSRRLQSLTFRGARARQAATLIGACLPVVSRGGALVHSIRDTPQL